MKTLSLLRCALPLLMSTTPAFANSSETPATPKAAEHAARRLATFRFRDSSLLFRDLQPIDNPKSIGSDCWSGANFAFASGKRRLGLKKIFVSDATLLKERFVSPTPDILENGSFKWVCSDAAFTVVRQWTLRDAPHFSEASAAYTIEAQNDGAFDPRTLLVAAKKSDMLFGFVMDHPFHSEKCVSAYGRGMKGNPDEEQREKAHSEYARCLERELKKDKKTLKALNAKIREALSLADF